MDDNLNNVENLPHWLFFIVLGLVGFRIFYLYLKSGRATISYGAIGFDRQKRPICFWIVTLFWLIAGIYMVLFGLNIMLDLDWVL